MHNLENNVYTRLGVRPVINANIPFTFLGGAPVWPEVRAAMAEAAQYSVDVVELQKAVGIRLAEISGAESGMISSGACGAMALATAACIAGADPEKIYQLPDTTGLKHKVILWGGRSVFDSSVRLAGGVPVVVHTLEELDTAIDDRTAMLCTTYPADPHLSPSPPPLDQMVLICKAADVPVFVDAAGGIPPLENLRRYPPLGVDLYGFSGGKGLRGPQASGFLLGRKDLIAAAIANASPVEGAVCRAMKVSKDQIVGIMAAVEKWLTIDLDTLYREQTDSMERVAAIVETVPDVDTKIEVRRGSNCFIQLVVEWDEEAFGLSVDECGRELREGDPPISVLSNYNPYLTRVRELFPDEPEDDASQKHRGSPLTVYSLSLKPGEDVIVGNRLRDVLATARAKTS